MNRSIVPLLLVASSLFLSACGSSSSSSGEGATQSAQFIDGPVKGIDYQRGGSSSVAKTSANGSFNFAPGETVVFSLGNITFGAFKTTSGTKFVTPAMLARESDTAHINVARLLISLDADQDPSNGIEISPVVQQAAKLYTGDSDFSAFDSNGLADFARTANNDGDREIVDANTAQAHLDASEADIADGRYDYDSGSDVDGDGINDAVDQCPNSAANAVVNEQGCAGQVEAEQDSDGDGIANSQDNCPGTSNGDQSDLDGDQRGDVCDVDQDGDGVINDDESETDPLNPDSDGDGSSDGSDNCPSVANGQQVDTDLDGLGDACDADRDNDGVANDDDAFPLDKNESRDNDGDGTGDNADTDDDNDGVPDSEDASPFDASENSDTDGDGIGNNVDSDDDGDGVADTDDAFPLDAAETTDSDSDDIGDNTDNCPTDVNEQQIDTDSDGLGDACDPDQDNDGVVNEADYCPNTQKEASVHNNQDGTALSTNNGCSTEQLAVDYCADGEMKTAGATFQQTIPSDNLNAAGDTPLTISFQVFEPNKVDCASLASGAHPIILHGHGFGGSRTTDKAAFETYLEQGYTVISIDQRGFGDSSGTIRVMDPEAEGKDLIAILDWAERELRYSAWRDEATKAFSARPESAESEVDGNNILVGAIGGSYGGGYQLLLLAVDEKNRLDALAPDITWHDLRYSLNPGDTIKSGWDLALVAGGESASYSEGFANQESPVDRGLDPYAKETLVQGAATNEFPRDALMWFNYHSLGFWCANQGATNMPYSAVDWGDSDQNKVLVSDAGSVSNTPPLAGAVDRQLPPVDVLLSQGFRDTLFNFNEAWWNYRCLSSLGGDVRLYTHQSGHILPVSAPDDSQPANNDVPLGSIPGFQDAGGSQACGSTSLNYTGSNNGFVLNWFNNKLKQQDVDTGSEDLCLSLADNDAVQLARENFIAPGENTQGYTPFAVAAENIANGSAAQALAANGPTVIELAEINAENGAILAGIPRLSVVVSTPDSDGRTAIENCNPPMVPTLRTGCDSIVFVGIGQQHGGEGSWDLIDDQVYPLRGLGQHEVDLNGIAERIATGDKLALLVYGYHPQFLATYSRDASIPLVNISGELELPLHAAVSDGGEVDLSRHGSETFDPCGNPEAGAVGEESLYIGASTSDFEDLDKDGDGCVQNYAFSGDLGDSGTDVVRQEDADVRDENTAVYDLDVLDWVAYVHCTQGLDTCSNAAPLVEVGNFDIDDEDSEIRANAPLSDSAINSLQWKPNFTAPVIGFSYQQLSGTTQPLMRVEFATDSASGSVLKANQGVPGAVVLQPGDKLIAVLWHQTGVTAGQHEINFLNDGKLAEIHLYLIRGGVTSNFYRKPGATSLQEFDPTFAEDTPGWLTQFISHWTVKEIAFDTGFSDSSAEPLLIDSVEMIIQAAD